MSVAEKPSPVPAPEPNWPEYTEEQTAAAKQMVADLGVVITEDAGGNVISVNTAANRSWVDNYQMEEILAFPRLTSLIVEGPSIDDALASKIAEQAGLLARLIQKQLMLRRRTHSLLAVGTLRAVYGESLWGALAPPNRAKACARRVS